MRRTIRKLIWVWDFDKEEKWLEEMSAKGLHLAAVGLFKYVFDEGTPGEYAVRLELLDNMPTHPESVQYIRFVEDTGAEYLGSVSRWVYFRKKTSEGSFDLFSDIESRIRHLNRILFLIGILTPIQIINAINNLSQYFFVRGFTSSLVVGCLCGLLGLLLLYGFAKIYRKKSRLKKERALHE